MPYWHIVTRYDTWLIYRYVDFYCAIYHIIWKSWFNFQRKNKPHHRLVCFTCSFPSLKNCAWSLTCHPLPQVAICLCCSTSVTETIWSVLFFTETVGVSMLNPFEPVIIFIHNCEHLYLPLLLVPVTGSLIVDLPLEIFGTTWRYRLLCGASWRKSLQHQRKKRKCWTWRRSLVCVCCSPGKTTSQVFSSSIVVELPPRVSCHRRGYG